MRKNKDNQDLYTKRQIAQLAGLDIVTVQRVLLKVKPDGKLSKWAAWLYSTFEENYKIYQETLPEPLDISDDNESRHNDPIDIELKQERILKLKIENKLRLNELFPKKYIYELIAYHSHIVSTKIKELIQQIPDHEDDLYNEIITDIRKSLESFICENGLEYIIQDNELQTIIDNHKPVDDLNIKEEPITEI